MMVIHLLCLWIVLCIFQKPGFYLLTSTLAVLLATRQYIDEELLHCSDVAMMAHASERLIVHTSPMSATTHQNNNNNNKVNL